MGRLGGRHGGGDLLGAERAGWGRRGRGRRYGKAGWRCLVRLSRHGGGEQAEEAGGTWTENGAGAFGAPAHTSLPVTCPSLVAGYVSLRTILHS